MADQIGDGVFSVSHRCESVNQETQTAFSGQGPQSNAPINDCRKLAATIALSVFNPKRNHFDLLAQAISHPILDASCFVRLIPLKPRRHIQRWTLGIDELERRIEALEQRR